MIDFFQGGIVGSNGNTPIGVPIGIIENDNGNTKLFNDSYEVFVNGDKVGDKIQLTQVEDAQDLKPYLENNGFKDFDYEVVGDHIEIKAGEDSHHMKEILSSYLSIK